MDNNVLLLPRPAGVWSVKWEALKVPKQGDLAEASRRFLAAVVSHEAESRYVYNYPTHSLGVLDIYPDSHGQQEAIHFIDSVFRGIQPSSSDRIEPLTVFRWLTRSYEYQLALSTEFLLNFTPVAYQLMEKYPQNDAEFENVLQASARLILSDKHDFLTLIDSSGGKYTVGLLAATQDASADVLIMELDLRKSPIR